MSDPSARQRLARTLGRRGLLVALVTAGALYLLLLVQTTIETLLTTISQVAVFGSNGGSGIYGLTQLGPNLASIWGSGVQLSLLTQLPFAVGVFLALWQILPIAPELRFAHVVTRSLFAAAIGSAAVLVVGIVQAIVLTALSLGTEGLGRAGSDAGHAIGIGLVGALFHAISTWVTEAPLVVLAGLLLWGWLQRFPPKHPVTGVLDEL